MPRIYSLSSLCFLALVLVSFASTAEPQRRPVAEKLTLVSQVPAPIPQRITGMAFDGEQLRLSIYFGKGHYATFDPKSQEWSYSGDSKPDNRMGPLPPQVAEANGIAFDGDVLWFGSRAGDYIGSMNTADLKVTKIFPGKHRADLVNGQSYASLAFDGEFIWAAWHMTEYRLPVSETQRLLKIDKASGVVVETFPLPPGSRQDVTHGLTFDGKNLWHLKGKMLSVIGLDGKVLSQTPLKELLRPSGLAWERENLWIVEFSGKLWKIPLAD